MKKVGINAEIGFGIEVPEMLKRIKAAGFDAVFVTWHEGIPLAEWKSAADALGLAMPFIHAPFGKIEYIWEDHELGDTALGTQLACLEESAQNNIPMVICHVFKGFGKPDAPNELGLMRLQKLVDRAQELGVKIAFENTEGEGYLDAVMQRFWDHPAAGFCIDTGHEICYNYGHDLISKYGDRLIATHLDDNLGIKGESIFWHDDLHLLPWDGKVDFEGVAKRIQKTPFSDILMFELTVKSKPGSTANDKYFEMGCEAYLAEAYRRAQKFASLFE